MKSSLKSDIIANKSKPIVEYESADLSIVYDKWQSPLLRSDYELVEAHRSVQEAKEKLTEKKREEELRDIDVSKKWQELRGRRELFEEIKVKQEEKLSEIRETCEEVESETTERCKTCDPYDEVVNRLKEKLEKLEHEEEELTTSIKKLKPFKDLLEDAVKNMNQFDNIHELVNYYKALIATKKKASDRLHRKTESIERTRFKIETFIKDEFQNLLVVDNQIAEARAEDKANEHLLKISDGILKSLEDATNEKLQNIEAVKLSINSIYFQLSKWKRKSAALKNDDYIGQLIRIEEIVAELQLMLSTSIELMRREQRSSRPNSTFLTYKREV